MANNKRAENNGNTTRDVKADSVTVSNGASAILKSHNQSPRKVRLVTDLVKGKKVTDALAALQFLPKRAAAPIAELIKSAVASAKAQGENVEMLKVKSITVDSAGMLKKYMPRAMGRASLIRGRKSQVKVTVA